MNTIGEYTGDVDDVLDRHGLQYDSGGRDTGIEKNPIHYPEWTDEKWARVWHQHRKYLKEKSRLQEAELLQTQEFQHNLQEKIAFLLSEVARKRELSDKQKTEAAQIISKSGGSTRKLQELYNTGNNDFSSQDTDQIIMWIVHYNMLKSNRNLNKPHRQLCKNILVDLYEELNKRGCPMDFVQVNSYFISISKEKKTIFQKQISPNAAKKPMPKNKIKS